MAMSTLVPAGLQPVERTLVPDPPLSDTEFEALCHAFDTVQFERTKEGVILMNPPAGGFTGRGNLQILFQLAAWCETHERGSVFDSNTGFYLRDNSMMSPDAAYVLPQTLEGITAEELTGFPHLCPDFVIELLSSSDRLAKAQAKMSDWIENGAKLGWLVDPYAKKVHVYERDVPTRIVSGASVRGTGPVEGFVLDLKKVWRRYQL